MFSWGVVSPRIFSLRIAPLGRPLIFLDLNKAAWQTWTGLFCSHRAFDAVSISNYACIATLTVQCIDVAFTSAEMTARAQSNSRQHSKYTGKEDCDMPSWHASKSFRAATSVRAQTFHIIGMLSNALVRRSAKGLHQAIAPWIQQTSKPLFFLKCVAAARFCICPILTELSAELSEQACSSQSALD